MVITQKNIFTIFMTLFIVRGLMQIFNNLFENFPQLALHASSLSLLAIIVVYYFTFFINKKESQIINIILGVFLFYLMLNIIITQVISVTDFTSYFIGILSFCFFLCFNTRINYQKALIAIIVIFFLQIIYLTFIHGFSFILQREGRNNLGSIFGHANSFALIVSAYFIFLLSTRKTINFYTITIYILLLSIVAVLGSRSIVIALFISVLFWLTIKKLNVFTVFLYFVTLGLTAFFIIDFGVSLLDSSWGEQSITSGNSLKWRIIHWSYYLNEFKSINDIVLGFGLGSHEYATLNIYDEFYEVHNDFIRIIYDIGVTGLVITTFFDIYIITYIFKRVEPNWGLIAILGIKYFFMLFDNYVTNLLPVISLSFIIFLYLNLQKPNVVNN